MCGPPRLRRDGGGGGVRPLRRDASLGFCVHCVFLDATYLHGREQACKQVISKAVIVAVGNRCAEA